MDLGSYFVPLCCGGGGIVSGSLKVFGGVFGGAKGRRLYILKLFNNMKRKLERGQEKI